MTSNSTTITSLTDNLAKEFIVDDQEEEESKEEHSAVPESLAEPFGGIAHDFREDTVFVLDIEADKNQPGTLRGERCPLIDITNNSYDYLYSQYPHWRRLLSDDYMRNTKLEPDNDDETITTHDTTSPSSTTITSLVLLHLDDHAWASIVHYLAASKLVQQKPEIYVQLCLDSADPLSQQSTATIKSLSQTIELSEEARKDWVENRKVAAWRRALLAKFAQNEDLQRALILTGWAKLVDKRGLPQYLLMWVRTVLRGEYQQQIQQQQQTMIKDMAVKIKEDKSAEDILKVFEGLFSKDKQQLLSTILSALSNNHGGGERKSQSTTTNKQQQTIQAKAVEMKDAVGYLEQIKNEESPQTYNKFLEIMTDFKSEKINTPQVLERVALLFKGKPWLISKFLMFLPPGHLLDLSPENKPNLIYITSPTGNKIIVDTDQGLVNFKKAEKEQ
ncbi:MAG: hypothetical protein EXX96DRAFT_622501 [Benjaminiella poitrasii]|nr:MAG: hypothetical protein EXX96DRAFT_622501 [Benjaminiella poitrasii]